MNDDNVGLLGVPTEARTQYNTSREQLLLIGSIEFTSGMAEHGVGRSCPLQDDRHRPAVQATLGGHSIDRANRQLPSDDRTVVP